MTQELPPVVVAVDGSDACVRALVWSFRHAVAHGRPVEALTTWPLHDASGHLTRASRGEPRWQAREVQAEAVARALAAVERVPRYRLCVDNAELVDALVKAGERAAMVVIGSDGPEDSTPARLHVEDRLRHELRTPLVVVGPDGPLAVPARTSARPHASP